MQKQPRKAEILSAGQLEEMRREAEQRRAAIHARFERVQELREQLWARRDSSAHPAPATSTSARPLDVALREAAAVLVRLGAHPAAGESEGGPAGPG